jgi:hypothetical protein
MYNPLADDFSKLSDSEIEAKISELGRKYFQTHNTQLQIQIATILDMYKEEVRARRARQYLKQKEQNGNNDLDNLINIS